MTERLMTSEKDVKKKVKAILNRFDWFFWCPPANGFGQTGISDFHAMKAAMFIAIETKFGRNKPTAMQVGFLNTIRACGGTAFVVTDKNWQHLEWYLESMDIAALAVRRGEPVPIEHGARMINAIAELSNKLLDIGSAPATAIEVAPDIPPTTH